MKPINWEVFFGNSSTEEAICLFALGRYSFKRFSLECWSRSCKNVIKRLKCCGYIKARTAAKRALKSRGFDLYLYKDIGKDFWETLL